MHDRVDDPLIRLGLPFTKRQQEESGSGDHKRRCNPGRLLWKGPDGWLV
jgi:hypothetical protein